MTKSVRIGNHEIGPGEPTFVIAEIGINHNGSLELALGMIDVAVSAGVHAVKFQKRTVDVVYSPEELAAPRKSVFGETNGDLKRGLEFGEREFRAIDQHARKLGILWSASPWDEESVDFLERFDVPFIKVASPSLTDDGLLRHIRSKGRPVVLSTGMSDMAMIEHAVEVLGMKDLVLQHCVSVYPANAAADNYEHGLRLLNLSAIKTLSDRFDVPVGFSANNPGIVPSYAAVVMGACTLEQHITLDRGIWGSDQGISIEPDDLRKLCRWVREFRVAKGDGKIRIYDDEVPVMKKLRRR